MDIPKYLSLTLYRHLSLISLSSLCLLSTQESIAGGFQLSDHSITGLGRSHAGYGVVGDDASAAHFNPAGMSLLKQKQFQIGAAYIMAEGKYTDLGSTGANTGPDYDGAHNSVTPNIYYVTPIGESLHFGLGITSPFGTNTQYPDDFIGRFSGLTTQIKTVNINPSIAYKMNDVVSLGFGLNYQTFEPTLSGAVSPLAANSTLLIEGESKNYGYNLGAMFVLDDSSQLGIGYRSKIHHYIKGTATFSNMGAANGTFAATADFTSPETAYAAYTRALNDRWRLSLGYRWTRWSRFQELNVLFPTGIASQSSSIDAQWSNVKTINIGTDYQLNNRWTVRAGLALDETPVPDSTRTVRTVDADRTWYTFGSTYQFNDRLQLDFAYRYISFENAPVNQTITRSGSSIGTLVGEYNNINVHTLAAQLNYKF